MRSKVASIFILLFGLIATGSYLWKNTKTPQSKSSVNEAGALPDYEITNFRAINSNYDEFVWAATLTNLGPGPVYFPASVTLHESVSQDFKTGSIRTCRGVTRVDLKKAPKYLDSGNSFEITGNSKGRTSGLVAGFNWTPTYAKIEINGVWAGYQSLMQTLDNYMNTGAYDPKRSIEETDYSNNVSGTIKIERESYEEKAVCEEIDNEDNDTPDAAQKINIGVLYTSNLCLDDRDFFKVQLEKDKSYEIELSKHHTVTRLVVIGPDNLFYVRNSPWFIKRKMGSILIEPQSSGWYTIGFIDETLGFVRTKTAFKIKSF